MIEIRQGDCKDYNWEGDCMVVDPPYSEHTHKSAVSQSSKGGARKREFGFDSISGGLMEFICKQAASANRWSVIFSDMESITLWKNCLEGNGAKYIRTLPWVRWSMPQLSGDRPPQGCEAIILAYGKGKGKKHWNGSGNLTHLNHLCLRGEGKHKTEKPLDLILDLVNWFSDLGETVIDPCLGSGTTGLACQILNRKFVGCELDPVWAERAKRRIEDSENAFSPRDDERYERWLASENKRLEEMKRMKEHTAKVRAKL